VTQFRLAATSTRTVIVKEAAGSPPRNDAASVG